VRFPLWRKPLRTAFLPAAVLARAQSTVEQHFSHLHRLLINDLKRKTKKFPFFLSARKEIPTSIAVFIVTLVTIANNTLTINSSLTCHKCAVEGTEDSVLAFTLLFQLLMR